MNGHTARPYVPGGGGWRPPKKTPNKTNPTSNDDSIKYVLVITCVSPLFFRVCYGIAVYHGLYSGILEADLGGGGCIARAPPKLYYILIFALQNSRQFPWHPVSFHVPSPLLNGMSESFTNIGPLTTYNFLKCNSHICGLELKDHTWIIYSFKKVKAFVVSFMIFVSDQK